MPEQHRKNPNQHRKRRGVSAFIGQDIVIHTVQGPSLRGVLQAAEWDGAILVNVKHLDDDAELAGKVGVPWGNLFFWQILPPGEQT